MKKAKELASFLVYTKATELLHSTLVQQAAEDVGKRSARIRFLLTVLFIPTLFVGLSCAVGTSGSEHTPEPIATTQVMVAATVTASPTVSPTPTVEPTATIASASTTTEESAVPIGKEEDSQGEAPNSKPDESVSQQVLGATLTIYNCIGSTGAVYCPEGSHTASGTIVSPGTAACDSVFLGRVFEIVGDRQGERWTCLDTGNFSGNLFDLWFYDLAVGQDYINNLPFPYQVVFVD